MISATDFKFCEWVIPGEYPAVSKKAKMLRSLLLHCSICSAAPLVCGTIVTGTTSNFA